MIISHLVIPATISWDGATSMATVMSTSTVVSFPPPPDDDGGLAGVREPRRPHPAAPASSLALDLP
jgi:hypothetical protein